MSIPCPTCGKKRVQSRAFICADCKDKGLTPGIPMQYPAEPGPGETLDVSELIAKEVLGVRRALEVVDAKIEVATKHGERVSTYYRERKELIMQLTALSKEARLRDEHDRKHGKDPTPLEREDIFFEWFAALPAEPKTRVWRRLLKFMGFEGTREVTA